MKYLSCVLVILPLLGGCSHLLLKHNTINQAETVSDIFQKQVLNNLAMFVDDPNSVPHFALPSQGQSGVNDSGRLDAGVAWNAGGFNMANLGGSGTHQQNQSWVLNPVTDPMKLRRMRCAFQRAVSSCGMGSESPYCPNCPELFEKFHGTSVEGANCLISDCWFCWGKHCDVPKNVPQRFVGRHRDTYVWVPHGPGRDSLARLTLLVLDYALYDPPSEPTKQVIAYLTEDGKAATAATANRVVTAVLRTTSEDLKHLDVTANQIEARIGELKSEIFKLEKSKDPNRETAIAIKQAELQSLYQQLEARRRFLLQGQPRRDTITYGILEFDQRLRALTGRPN